MHIDRLRAVLVGCLLLWSMSALANSDYRLGPQDLLRIAVFGSPELSSEARVSASGYITYPLVGQLAVAGRTPAQVEAMLSARLVEGGYVREPQVSVHVLEFRSQKVAVLGHVAKPGQYALQSASTLLDVIAEAGGLLNDEAGDSATLISAGGAKTPIDLTALFSGDPAQNRPVAGGDTVYVPRAAQFYIYGEVQRPGRYKLERSMTVSRAISAGGGLTTRGSERRVVVKRRTADGKELQVKVRSADVLQPDDVLFVKEGFF